MKEAGNGAKLCQSHRLVFASECDRRVRFDFKLPGPLARLSWAGSSGRMVP